MSIIRGSLKHFFSHYDIFRRAVAVVVTTGNPLLDENSDELLDENNDTLLDEG